MSLQDFNQAIISNDTARITAMLSLSPDLVNEANSQGQTPIDLAVSRADIDVVESLLDHGAVINKQEKLFGAFPLMQAVVRNRPEITQLLLERGANVNARDHEGHTALSCATSLGLNRIARMLLDCGAS